MMDPREGDELPGDGKSPMLMTLIVGALVVTLALVVYVAFSFPARTAGCMAPRPPWVYDHPAAKSYRVLEMASQYMQALIEQDPSYDGGTLCGFARQSAHVIVMLKGMSPEAYASVLRHEIGHLNGWRHPG